MSGCVPEHLPRLHYLSVMGSWFVEGMSNSVLPLAVMGWTLFFSPISLLSFEVPLSFSSFPSYSSSLLLPIPSLIPVLHFLFFFSSSLFSPFLHSFSPFLLQSVSAHLSGYHGLQIFVLFLRREITTRKSEYKGGSKKKKKRKKVKWERCIERKRVKLKKGGRMEGERNARQKREGGGGRMSVAEGEGGVGRREEILACSCRFDIKAGLRAP